MVDFKYYLYSKLQDNFFYINQNISYYYNKLTTSYYYNKLKSKTNVIYFTYFHDFNKNVVKF